MRKVPGGEWGHGIGTKQSGQPSQHRSVQAVLSSSPRDCRYDEKVDEMFGLTIGDRVGGMTVEEGKRREERKLSVQARISCDVLIWTSVLLRFCDWLI